MSERVQNIGIVMMIGGFSAFAVGGARFLKEVTQETMHHPAYMDANGIVGVGGLALTGVGIALTRLNGRRDEQQEDKQSESTEQTEE